MIAYKISKNAKILFVGINPHPGSYRRGVPFSNNKMFWYLLNRAGLLEEAERDLKNDESLKQLYDNRFVRKYALNFVNLVDRPTVDVTELEKGEEQAGDRARNGNHSSVQAQSGLFHREGRTQQISRHPGMRLRLAEKHRERQGLSDAFSDPRSGRNPSEGTERSETSQRIQLSAAKAVRRKRKSYEIT